MHLKGCTFLEILFFIKSVFIQRNLESKRWSVSKAVKGCFTWALRTVLKARGSFKISTLCKLWQMVSLLLKQAQQEVLLGEVVSSKLLRMTKEKIRPEIRLECRKSLLSKCCRWFAWLNPNHPVVPVEDAGRPLTTISENHSWSQVLPWKQPFTGGPFFWKDCPASQQSVCAGDEGGLLKKPKDSSVGITDLNSSL